MAAMFLHFVFASLVSEFISRNLCYYNWTFYMLQCSQMVVVPTAFKISPTLSPTLKSFTMIGNQIFRLTTGDNSPFINLT